MVKLTRTSLPLIFTGGSTSSSAIADNRAVGWVNFGRK